MEKMRSSRVARTFVVLVNSRQKKNQEKNIKKENLTLSNLGVSKHFFSGQRIRSKKRKTKQKEGSLALSMRMKKKENEEKNPKKTIGSNSSNVVQIGNAKRQQQQNKKAVDKER